MATFARIRDLLARDLNRPIEEIIKLSQTDENAVYAELTEYVVTDNLRRHYTALLRAINESVTNPTENIGVWVSGFFGSGKSAFVKNLGYILTNPTVKGQPAAELFIQRVREAAPGDAFLPDLIRNLVRKVPFEVIMFDVSTSRAVQTGNELLAEVMYRVLLDHLDYTYRNYEIAELEIELEQEDRLAEFVRTIAEMWREQGRSVPPAAQAPLPVTLEGQVSVEDYASWRVVRSGPQAANRASAALHRLDPATYPQADSWAKTVRSRPVDVHLLIKRTFDLAARRRPGKAVVFIIDEVGQYVARSGDKILDLQGVVREFGAAGRNKAVRGEFPAPVWLIVTAQEKLSEVVDAIGDKRVELAKLQDSFPHKVDLGPQDIQEVAARRVLLKKPEAIPFLKDLFERHRGKLNSAVALEQSGRFRPVDMEEFVDTYPYLPHHIGLSIDIMSALRLQSGGLRHLGGSNRTIIKQAHEMLIHPQTRLADAPVGTLVTFDKVYALVSHNLSSEKQGDIDAIDRAFGPDSWEAKVARVLALIEQVQHLPRTPHNLAALLYPHLGADLPLQMVEEALQNLENLHFARRAEGGWKLLTVAEKSWDAERREIKPAPSQERELLREALQRLWNEPALRSVAYRDLRNFTFQVKFHGQALSRGGDLELHLILADEPEEISSRITASRQETRAPSHRHEIHWVFPLTGTLDNALQELARSAYMVSRYDQLDAQGVLEDGQRVNLQNEKRNRQRWEMEVDRLLREALLQGVGVFQGQARPAAQFQAREWKEVVRGLVQWVVPLLYAQLETGHVSLPSRVAQEVLQARDLGRLPPVFYEGEDGLAAVVEGPDGFILNQDAPVVREIRNFMQAEQEYGHSVTGKKLEEHFAQPPYGWRTELLQAVLALLLRTGQVEIVVQGRRHRNPDAPAVRKAFGGIRDFRSASFRLRQEMGLRELARAAKTLETIQGRQLSPEETVIYEAAHAWATEMATQAQVVLTRLRDAGLMALLEPVETFLRYLERLNQSESDEVVHLLAGEGEDLRASWEGYLRVRPLAEDNILNTVHLARQALEQWWPEIADEHPDWHEPVRRAQEWLHSVKLPEHLGEVQATASDVAAAYRQRYTELHEARRAQYQKALETVRTWPEWEQVEAEGRLAAIRPLLERACDALDYDDRVGLCRSCGVRLATMRSDLRAVAGYQEEVRQALRERIPPEVEAPSVVRLRLGDLAPVKVLRTAEDVEMLLSALRQALVAHLEEGQEVELE